jgi:hypothetical protein
MKRVLLLMVICLSCAAHAEDHGAVLLRRAAHCLAAKSFLPPTKTAKMTFGYLLDEKSYPGEKMLYIVNYPSPSRPDGFAFTIFLTEHDGRLDFNIQNNTRFTLFKDGVKGVTFVDPPLGGTWTQEHLVSAIEQIEKQPRLSISIKNLLAADSSVSCEAYTDPQPKPSAKTAKKDLIRVDFERARGQV